MVLKLYGYPISTCTKRAATVLHEKKVPFEFILVDLVKAEHKTPEFTEKNPFNLIPCLEDNGVFVYESRAIGRYIATKYADQGTPLLPKSSDLKAVAAFEQALSIESQNFDKFAQPAAIENGIHPLMGAPTDEALVAEYLEKLEPKLAAYDKILSKQKYLAGDEVSLADVFHLAHGALLVTPKRDIMSEYPNVARWFNSLLERESWKALSEGVKSVPVK
ncbi:glutathione S-transferase [Flagelloscypha sp. PMI_526]|nr:glutathione S-transferase [Flagelloscypha sp. PMI_526]